MLPAFESVEKRIEEKKEQMKRKYIQSFHRTSGRIHLVFGRSDQKEKFLKFYPRILANRHD